MKAIGIREILSYFDGDFNLDEAKEKIIVNLQDLQRDRELLIGRSLKIKSL